MKNTRIFLLITVMVIFSLCSRRPGNSVTVVCMGDSLTSSSYGNYPSHLKKLFARKKIESKIVSLARPGNTSGEYLKYIKNSDPLKNIKSDMVVLMLGTNDVRVDGDRTSTPAFISNMLQIIRRIKLSVKDQGKEIKIFIATPPPIFVTDLATFNEESVTRIKTEIVPAIKKISNDEKLFLIDINNFFNENRSLLPGIHPSPAGYYKMAKFIFKNMIEKSEIIEAGKTGLK